MSIENRLWLVVIAGLIGSLFLMSKMLDQVPGGQLSSASLSRSEKLYVWLVCLFSPILGGTILYYGLRKKLPTKAKEANRISWMAFIVILLPVLVDFLFGLKS